MARCLVSFSSGFRSSCKHVSHGKGAPMALLIGPSFEVIHFQRPLICNDSFRSSQSKAFEDD